MKVYFGNKYLSESELEAQKIVAQRAEGLIETPPTKLTTSQQVCVCMYEYICVYVTTGECVRVCMNVYVYMIQISIQA